MWLERNLAQFKIVCCHRSRERLRSPTEDLSELRDFTSRNLWLELDHSSLLSYLYRTPQIMGKLKL